MLLPRLFVAALAERGCDVSHVNLFLSHHAFDLVNSLRTVAVNYYGERFFFLAWRGVVVMREAVSKWVWALYEQYLRER